MVKTRLYNEILKTSENVLSGISNVNNAFIDLFKQCLRVGDNNFLKTFKSDKAIIDYLSTVQIENVFSKRILNSFSLFSISVDLDSIKSRKTIENRSEISKNVLNVFDDYLNIIHQISKINARLCSMFFGIPLNFCELISKQNTSEYRETTSKIKVSFTPNCTENELKMLFSEESSADLYTKQVLFLGEFYRRFSEDLFINPARLSEMMACSALQIDPVYHPYEGLDDEFLTDEEFGLLRCLDCGLYTITLATRRRLQVQNEDEKADSRVFPVHDCPPVMAETLVFSELYIACLGNQETWSCTAFTLAWFLYYRVVLDHAVNFDRSVYPKKTLDDCNKTLRFCLSIHGYNPGHPIQKYSPEDKADLSNKNAENCGEDYVVVDKQPYFALSYCPECGKPLIITEYSRFIRSCPFCGKSSCFSSPEAFEAD